MNSIVSQIQNAKSLVLSTHRHCDGDGLGAQIAVYYALKKAGYNVRIINVDPTPKKYQFLQPDKIIQYYESNPGEIEPCDLVLIFDTNDERLLQPLYSQLNQAAKQILFIDHHPLLTQGPRPSQQSFIDITAASTGELAYRLIKSLGIQLDHNIAQALYTSITFDTQLYRFIRSSKNSHLIAAELLDYNINTEEIHRSLFGNQTVLKISFLAKTLSEIEYHCNGRLAWVKINDKDLNHFQLETDESRDVIDMIMNIQSLEAAALVREDSPSQFKISFRSKGGIEVLSIAELIGGGGHVYSSGAYVQRDLEDLKRIIIQYFQVRL